MPDNRIEKHREYIDECDEYILGWLFARIYRVGVIHRISGATEPRYDYARETAIHERYAEAFEAAGIPRIHAHRVAAAVIDAGKAGIRAKAS